MQVNGSRDMAVRQYTQTLQDTQTTSAAEHSPEHTGKTAGKAISRNSKEQNMDRAEFNKRIDVTKMNDSERAELVEDLKADLDHQMDQFTNMMMQTFQKQGITVTMSQGNDFWKMIANGNFTVDAETKEEAQAAIAEDGYWGVTQTSQRLFDFALALAGDDTARMEQLQKAMTSGFEQAAGAWGGALPSLCEETQTAANKLFEDYYAQRSESPGE